MYVDCPFCQALALPVSERPARFRQPAALVLVFEATGERVGLCKVCAAILEGARARFGPGPQPVGQIIKE
jgi:hypothetical protein